MIKSIIIYVVLAAAAAGAMFLLYKKNTNELNETINARFNDLNTTIKNRVLSVDLHQVKINRGGVLTIQIYQDRNGEFHGVPSSDNKDLIPFELEDTLMLGINNDTL